MQIAFIGLGRMGLNMARRLVQGGHQVLGFDRSLPQRQKAQAEGIQAMESLPEMVEKLEAPRLIWSMLPAGEITAGALEEIKDLLAPGDIVVEGGNSYFKDDIRWHEAFGAKDIRYLDVGVSGGIWGLKVGYCLMIGGERSTFEYLEPIFKTLAPKDGYQYCGPAGAGHFVKMVHNGIEYGMMQAYAEGFEILDASPYGKDLDFAKLSNLWNQGSVVRSWLLELLEEAFSKDSKLQELSGFSEDSGEGRWTVQQALELGVPAPVITMSLMRRFRSRQDDPFGDRVIAALRREFGGHAVKGKE